MMTKPRDGDPCICGDGFLVEKGDWLICCACGGATTPGGKYLPPQSGWDIPALTPVEIQEAVDHWDRDWTERQFLRDALGVW